ncbi:hypothetical protein Salat_0195300 [Sesamum alatum]|uniref:Uncharacterized protein n=1 Tax=Sesamum alatum TaxID=300844 RepID=A0AAE1YZ38_9LAMI|nr:hypothetical protein Salat_0195300 [Sesamum alatum]
MADPHLPSTTQPNPQAPLTPDTTARQKGSGSGTHLKDNLSTNDIAETAAEAINQNDLQEIGEDSGDDFNYDDPIIAELLDKIWDEELARHRKSPNDKAVHFDIASTKPGNEGGTTKEQENTHCSNIHKQLPFTPAWSLEEHESDIMETHKEETRTMYKGDISTHQFIGSQDTEVASEGEEESTPIFNRRHRPTKPKQPTPSCSAS